MMWDRVLTALSAVANGDPVLLAIYAGAVRLAGTGKHRTPLLEYSLIGDAEGELWAPHTVQWDQWTSELQPLLDSERRLRRLFHVELPSTFAGLTMWSVYAGGDVLAMPDRDGYYGRAIRFTCTPLRELYEAPSSP